MDILYLIYNTKIEFYSLLCLFILFVNKFYIILLCVILLKSLISFRIRRMRKIILYLWIVSIWYFMYVDTNVFYFISYDNIIIVNLILILKYWVFFNGAKMWTSDENVFFRSVYYNKFLSSFVILFRQGPWTPSEGVCGLKLPLIIRKNNNVWPK